MKIIGYRSKAIPCVFYCFICGGALQDRATFIESTDHEDLIGSYCGKCDARYMENGWIGIDGKSHGASVIIAEPSIAIVGYKSNKLIDYYCLTCARVIPNQSMTIFTKETESVLIDKQCAICNSKYTEKGWTASYNIESKLSRLIGDKDSFLYQNDEDPIKAISHINMQLAGLIQKIKEVKSDLPVRERALAKSRLQEARFWLMEALNLEVEERIKFNNEKDSTVRDAERKLHEDS